MQHKQFNFVRMGTKIAVLIFALVMPGPVLAGPITQPSKPDLLLDPTNPCAAGVDYADGVDANGQAVVPADVAARRVPLPDSLAVPLGHARAPNQGPGQRRNQAGNLVRQGPAPSNPVTLGGDSTYIVLDGRKLEPLVNPAPCAPVH